MKMRIRSSFFMAQDLDPKTQLWVDRYRIAEGHQAPLFKRFAAWYDLMNAVIDDSYAPWRSQVFLPYLAGRAWSLIPKLVSGNPGWQVTCRDVSDDPQKNFEYRQSAHDMQDLLDYQYQNPELDQPMFKKLTACLVDSAVTGKGIAKVPWVSETRELISRATDADKQIILGKEKVKKVKFGYPDLVPHNILHTYVSPSGVSLQEKRWVILKSWETLESLKSINNQRSGTFFKNLDNIGLEQPHQADTESQQYNVARNRLVGGGADPIAADSTINSVELWECYDNQTKEIVWIANRNTEIRRITNPYWHGKMPLVDFEVKPRPFDFWGYGIFEINERMQLAANDVFNHYMDNLNLSLDGMVIENTNSEVEDYLVQPGGHIRWSGTVKPEQWKFPDPNPTNVEMVLNKIQGNIEDNTISPYAAGMPQSAADTTAGTKGGIIALQGAANDTLSFMRQSFLSSVHEFGHQWMVNNQQFMDKSEMVPKNIRGKQIVKQVNPSDIQGDFHLQLSDKSMDPPNQDKDRADFIQYIQQLLELKRIADQSVAMGAQDPNAPSQPLSKPVVINWDEVAMEMSERFGIHAPERFLGSPQDLPPAQPPAPQPSEPNLSPTEKIIETIDFKDLPEDAKQQVLEQVGVHSQMPSPVEQQNQLKAAQIASQHTNTQTQHQLQADQQQHQQGMDQINAQQQQQQMDQQAQQPSQGSESPQGAPESPQEGENPQAPGEGQGEPEFDLTDPKLIDHIMGAGK